MFKKLIIEWDSEKYKIKIKNLKDFNWVELKDLEVEFCYEINKIFQNALKGE